MEERDGVDLECPQCDGHGYLCGDCREPIDVLEADSNNGLCKACFNYKKETVKNG